MMESCKKQAAMTYVIALAVITVALSGCGGQKTAVKDFDAQDDESAALQARLKKGVKPEPDPEVAVIEIANFGNMVIELYPNVAPKMVARYKQLSKDGYYNSTTYQRIDLDLGNI